ncbi:MAG: NUDIX hydrolase [Jatrophihabitantaceae bacterium]
MNDIRQTGTREIYASPWLRLREDAIEYADGSASTYAIVERTDFVTVLPYENGGFWLVEQFRYPLGRRVWELPQGAWPAGRTGTVEELAVAELVEETGLRADQWRHLGRLAANAGMSGQYFDVLLATELTAGKPRREASEQDMVHRWFTDTDVRAMIGRSELVDVHTVAALALFDLHR